MKNKVIVLDIDGTLMPSNNILDQETKGYLNFLDKDNLVVLTSGRSYHDLLPIHKEIGLTSPMICSNGSTLHFMGTRDDVTLSINPEYIKDIFRNYKHTIVSSFYSYKNKLFIYNKMDKLSFLYKINDDCEIIEGSFDELDLLYPNSVYLILNNSLKNEVFDYIDQNYSNQISYFEYGHDLKYSITILSMKNVDKAYAILELLLLTNKKEKDLIVIGDGPHDVNMLSLDGITAAMKNGISEVKQVAKYVTKYDNNNQGVLRFLKEIEENKKGI